MINYFASLRPASFRNLPFVMQDSDSGFGRKTIRHDYPGRDDPYYEDLGAAPQEFSLQAIITGENWLEQANAFETALKQKGPGTLRHPFYGELAVLVTEARRQDSTERAGEIRFQISFALYGPQLYPRSDNDTVSGLTSSSD